LDLQFEQMGNDLAFAGNVASLGIEQLFYPLDQFARRKAARGYPSAAGKSVDRITDLRQYPSKQPIGRSFFSR